MKRRGRPDATGPDATGPDATGPDASRVPATPPRPRQAPEHRRPGDARPSVELLVRASLVATISFAMAAVASAAAPQYLAGLGVGVSLLLFGAGVAAFAVGYGRAVQRSRSDELDLPGLFFLVDSVEPAVRRRLTRLLVVQVVVGVAAAAVRPFTPVAFCTLAPIFGLGVMALCGATHGAFRRRVR